MDATRGLPDKLQSFLPAVLAFAAAAAARAPRPASLPLPSHDHVPNAFAGPVVSMLQLKWYARRPASPDFDPVGVFVDAAEQVFPGAVPIKFGSTEPFRRSFARAGLQGLRDAVAAGGGVWTVGNQAMATTFFPGVPDAGLFTMECSLIADGLTDDDLARVRQLFATIAAALDCFCAITMLVPGWEKERNKLYMTKLANQATWNPARVLRGDGAWHWMGLCPAPAVWTWLAGPYAHLLEELPSNRVERRAAAASTMPAPQQPTAPASP